MKSFTLVAALTLTLGLSVGCESTEKVADEDEPITADSVLKSMSPNLDHRSRTNYEAKITHARTIDLNGRSAWDDLERILLLDRPSRQSLYPTP